MHFRQVLVLDIAEVGVAVVDEFALDGLVILLISDEAGLVVFGAVLGYHIGPCPSAGTGTLQFATAGGGV